MKLWKVFKQYSNRTLAAQILGTTFLFSFCYYFFLNLTVDPEIITNLKGQWNYCHALSYPSEPEFSPERCEWKTINIPSDIPSSERNQFTGKLVYTKKFKTPDACKNIPCSILIGELGDAGRVYLNGHLLGQNGKMPPNPRYEKHYPFRADISPSVLSNGENELVIETYSFKLQQTGPRRGPVAIVQTDTAKSFVKAKVLYNVFLPLAVAVGLLICGIFISLSLSNEMRRDKLGVAFLSYCLSQSVFLVSFSEIPREFLPLSLAVPLHFYFRYLSDWYFFDLVNAYFGFQGRLKKWVTWIYAILTGPFVLLGFLGVISIFSTWPGIDLIGTTYFLTRTAFVLKLFPFVFAISGVLKISDVRKKFLGVAGVSFLLGFQINDILLFFGLIQSLYLVKFYPLIIAIVGGYLIVRRSNWITLQKRLSVESEAAVGRVARQVSHDIRSPLVALDSLRDEFNRLPETTRDTTKNAIQRIQDIANLLQKQPLSEQNPSQTKSSAEPQLLTQLLESILSEKRTEYRRFSGHLAFDLVVSPNAHTAFAKIAPIEFKRLISNLINNAVEAMANVGHVEITVTTQEDAIVIEIRDQGPGFDSAVLQSIGSMPVSTKPNGQGLGLQHAFETLKNVGGSIKVLKGNPWGSIVQLRLNLAPTPAWLADSITLFPSTKAIVILDDDQSIHNVWMSRFRDCELDLKHFYSADELLNYFLDVKDPKFLFLIDYQLIGSKINGLDVIEQLGVASNAILVTSRVEDCEIRKRADRLGVRVLPKFLADKVPLELEKDLSRNIVLLDDDALVRTSWENEARKAHVELTTFATRAELVRMLPNFSKETRFYIDFELGDIKGDEVCDDLHARGYRNLYITTGHMPEHLAGLRTVRGIVGKRFADYRL